VIFIGTKLSIDLHSNDDDDDDDKNSSIINDAKLSSGKCFLISVKKLVSPLLLLKEPKGYDMQNCNLAC
jgi:hypothetical protein